MKHARAPQTAFQESLSRHSLGKLLRFPIRFCKFWAGQCAIVHASLVEWIKISLPKLVLGPNFNPPIDHGINITSNPQAPDRPRDFQGDNFHNGPRILGNEWSPHFSKMMVC